MNFPLLKVVSVPDELPTVGPDRGASRATGRARGAAWGSVRQVVPAQCRGGGAEREAQNALDALAAAELASWGGIPFLAFLRASAPARHGKATRLNHELATASISAATHAAGGGESATPSMGISPLGWRLSVRG